MKAQLYTPNGEKKSQIELPKIFSTAIREDIIQKYFQSDKFIQPYSSDIYAGKRASASGKIRHQRHRWRSHYGRGIARLPRKTMWRRGTQFLWVGAFTPGTRGGRKAHPPKGVGKEKKINKKEIKLAMNSALAATANQKLITRRYSTMEKTSFPAVIESLPKKTKELLTSLKSIAGENFSLVVKKKTVRAGKGKLRNRKYKSNAGILILTAKNEKASFKGLDIKPVSEVTISDLYPLGRLTLYTQKSLGEIK